MNNESWYESAAQSESPGKEKLRLCYESTLCRGNTNHNTNKMRQIFYNHSAIGEMNTGIRGGLQRIVCQFVLISEQSV